MVDKPVTLLTAEDSRLLEDIAQPLRGRRKIYFCDKRHKNFGNTCRRNAFEKATGDYILQIDDDDYQSDSEVLRTLECVVETWAIFPTLSRGKKTHCDPPSKGHTGSAMFMYRRDTGIRFPDNDHYAADGEVVEELKKKYAYQALNIRPLVIYPWANHGMEQEEIDKRVAARRLPIKYAKDGCTIEWQG